MRKVASLKLLPEAPPEFLRPHSGVLTLSGYGVRVCIESGHLCVEDGVGAKRRKARFSRVTSRIKRLIVIGHSGTISFDALRWLHDIKAAFVQIDNDGEVITASTRPSLNDSRLRRAQAMAITNSAGIAIGRELTKQKLEGQAKILERLRLPAATFTRFQN